MSSATLTTWNRIHVPDKISQKRARAPYQKCFSKARLSRAKTNFLDAFNSGNSKPGTGSKFLSSAIHLSESSLFSDCSERFLQSVKLASVSAESGVLVTEEDQLYVFGALSNALDKRLTSNCFHAQVLHRGRCIDDLCNLGVVGIAPGKKHLAVWNKVGCLITCGDNTYGQLGYDHHDGLPRTVNGDLLGRRVIKAVCTDKQTVCLTDEGGVYCFGSQKKIPPRRCHKRSILRLQSRSSDVISDIACTEQTVYLLLRSGKVYSYNWNSSTNRPTRIPRQAIPKPIRFYYSNNRIIKACQN